MKTAACGLAVGLTLLAAAPAAAQTKYPALPGNAFKAQVARSLAVIDQGKVVYTEEFMANSCLLTLAQLQKGISERHVSGNAVVRLSTELAKQYDECLASNGYAYKPKPPAGKPKPKPRTRRV